MESKIEEQKIELFPDRKPLKQFQTESLNDILKCNKVEKIYYSSHDLGNEFISGIYNNTLLKGYYDAYVNHCPIVITPDILWMLVVEGFSRHVEMNAEELRKKFVNFEGKKELVVDYSNRAEIEDITKKEWENLFDNFVSEITKNIGGLMINLITPCFTTSTKITQSAAQIAIMSTFKSYFKYVTLYGGCGFPYILLKGSLMDYMQLKFKIKGLYGYLIDDWIDELVKIADKILETKQGNVDKEFWKNFIKNYEDKGTGGSGATIVVNKISGWLLKFYPFYKEKKQSIKNGRFICEYTYTRRKLDDEYIDTRELKKIPNEIIDAPLTMKNVRTGKETLLSCKTGFIGMTQNKKSLVNPEIGCFVCEQIDEQIEKTDPYGY